MDRVFRFASWMVVVCLLLQAMATSAGGVLCIGCLEVGSGVRIAAALCASEESCCGGHTEVRAGDIASPQSTSIDSRADCGCIDLILAPRGNQIAVPSQRCARHHAFDGPEVAALPQTGAPAALWPPGDHSIVPRPQRAVAHLRSPLSLRTVLRI